MYDGSGVLFASNDNWQDAANRQEIIDSTIPPSNDLESAFLDTLTPGNCTAVVSGVGNGTAIGVVEAYDLDRSADSKFANIATRGRVLTGDNVMIGGLIVTGPDPQKVIIRARGPSLPVDGRPGDPSLALFDNDGVLLQSNDNWRNDQQPAIEATCIPPTNDLESTIVTTLAPGAYTAVVAGVNSTSGVALVAIYSINEVQPRRRP